METALSPLVKISQTTVQTSLQVATLKIAKQAMQKAGSMQSASTSAKIARCAVSAPKNDGFGAVAACGFCNATGESLASPLVRVSKKLMSCIPCLSPSINYYEVH